MMTYTSTELNRRDRERMPLDLPLRFGLVENGETVEAGAGATVDISRTGLAFTAARVLPVGHDIELCVRWPTEPGQSPVCLAAHGRVVRTDGALIACSIDSYEFRPAEIPMLSHADCAGMAA